MDQGDEADQKSTEKKAVGDIVTTDTGGFMSFLATTVMPEGIVMTADSATSALKMMDIENFQNGNLEAALENLVSGQIFSNPENVIDRKIVGRSTRKLFVMSGNNIAISSGHATRSRQTGISIMPNLEYFLLNNRYDNPKSCAENLLEYIQNIDPALMAKFHVCGYNPEGNIPVPEFWHVDIAKNAVMKVCGDMQYGICWSGSNNYFLPYKEQIDRNLLMYSLQDAIDVTMFAVEVSMKLGRFLDMNEGIAPPIDLLVITQKGVEWIQRKTLNAGRGI